MDKEYIERKALVEAIGRDYETISFLMVAKHIEEAPAANVVEVKRGNWKIEKRKNIWGEYMEAIVCSECGGISQHGLKTKYCSRCGAEMEGMD